MSIALPRPPRDLAIDPVLRRSHRDQQSRTITAVAATCPRSLWKCFSGTTVLPDKVLRQFSTNWARSWVRRAVWLTESTPCREKRSSALARIYSFPNWPEGAERQELVLTYLTLECITGMPCRRRIETWKHTSFRSIAANNLGDGCTRKCVSTSIF